jgi:uncharacterized protein YggE
MKSWFAAALSLGLAISAPALAENSPPVPMLTANGDGVTMVTPDIAIVTIGVLSRAPTASAALDANSADLGKALEAIKAAGIADKDIRTSGFSVSPVYAPPPERATGAPLPITGYQVSNEVRVTVRDIAKSGALLDKVVRAGANQVSGIAFDIADRQSAEDAALKAAIAEARRTGELMAEAAGVKLVRVVNISASANHAPMPMMARADFGVAKAVPVMGGEQAVNANASIVWEIAPK